jgi:hypothetical protein
VQCAAGLLRALRTYNALHAQSRHFHARMGVHLGDGGGGDVPGDVTKVASGLRAMAPAGTLLMSDQIYEDVRSTTDLKFEERGVWFMPGIPHRVKVWGWAHDNTARSQADNGDVGTTVRGNGSAFLSRQTRRLAAAIPIGIVLGLTVLPVWNAHTPVPSEASPLFADRYRAIDQEAGDVRRAMHWNVEPRSGEYVAVDEDPRRFMIALGFVAKGMAPAGSEAMSAEMIITGLSADPWPAFKAQVLLRQEDDWKRVSIAKVLGVNAVIGAVGTSADGDVPFALVIDCLAASEMRAWTGEITIQISDRQTGGGAQSYALQLRKPTEIAEDASCP